MKKNGFTLVELLAVIVILAIILVIAVPQITNTIKSARKGSLESTAKMIAASAETEYQTQLTLGTATPTAACSAVANLPEGIADGNCTITFDANGTATVVITAISSGKFDTCAVTTATRNSATITGSKCV